ncbi:hypothetical protein [Halomarina oriensis]|uniref:CAP domain-containing protein n=1 Tax=Halomarina oriensis TaxID=671145 RepID=A0A6B0GG80_9EURY|nr:hypothetical protein [Halomarina oriensis]MWG33520.1 hypothetical protein [Halomarina oriensis]
MVNKVLVLVLGAVVIASLVVGGLLGMQFGGSVGETTPAVTATPAGQSAPASTTPATSAPTTTTAVTADPTTASSTPDPTATPEPTPTFSASSVNTTAVEGHLRVAIDEEVRSGLGSLADEATLGKMAQSHSDAMADQGYPAHAANGLSTRARYEKFDRYNHCRVPNDDNRGIRDGEELEVITRITLETGDDPNERVIADQLLAEWTADETATEKLSLQNAKKAGVGVTVTDDGYVYATVDLC